MDGETLNIEWKNTALPTQLVVGRTTAEKVTDAQLDNLLHTLDEYAAAYANEFWAKYNKVLVGLPIDHPDKLRDMREIVREALAKL